MARDLVINLPCDKLERDQHWTRLAVVSAGLAYFCSRWIIDGAFGPETAFECLVLLSTSFAMFIWERVTPGPNPLRRVVGSIHDNVWIAYFLCIAPDAASPLFAIYPFMTIGNGFRYGNRYLYFNLALNLVGFGVVIASTAFWRTHLDVAVGIVAILIIVPLYVATLNRKLEVAREDLNQARLRAEASNQAKSRFLSTMSHEMRTPLNAVIQSNELLLKYGAISDWKQFVSEANLSARHLLGLINKVLDVARIEANRVEILRTPFALRKLLDESMESLRAAAQERSLDFTWSVDEGLHKSFNGSPTHIRQVLINLVSNSIRFTDSGFVRVWVSRCEDGVSEGRVRFTVEDSSKGISADVLTIVVAPFFQDRSAPNSRPGNDLDTTVNKDYVERMGGRIETRCEIGSGNVCWFELPLDSADEALNVR